MMDCRAELPEQVILTFGYAGRSVDDLAAIVAEYDAVILDCRLKPWTKQAGWSLPELKARFVDQYHWVRALGNTNFEKGGTIKLLDAKKGLRRVLDVLAEGAVPLLLCAERSPWQCHRRVIAESVAEKVGCRVLHLPLLPSRSAGRPAQLALDFGLPAGTVHGHIRASRHAKKSKRSQRRRG